MRCTSISCTAFILTQEGKPTANLRQLTRIAFSLRSGALLRLIAYAESHPLLKNAEGKTRVRVFLGFDYFLIRQKREVNEEKNRHADARKMRFKRGLQARSREQIFDLRTRRFAIACKPKACVPPQAGFARLGLFAVEISYIQTQPYTKPKYISKDFSCFFG